MTNSGCNIVIIGDKKFPFGKITRLVKSSSSGTNLKKKSAYNGKDAMPTKGILKWNSSVGRLFIDIPGEILKFNRTLGPKLIILAMVWILYTYPYTMARYTN